MQNMAESLDQSGQPNQADRERDGEADSGLPITQIEDSTSEWSSLDLIPSQGVASSVSGVRRRALPAFAVGVVGLGVLFSVGMTVFRHRIESSLTAQSNIALKAAGINGVEVTFTGRDAEVRVPKGVDVQRVRDAIRSGNSGNSGNSAFHFAGPRTVEVIVDPSLSPPPTSAPAPVPQDISAKINQDGTLQISGVVESQEAKDALVAGIKGQAPSANIQDQTTIGPGGASARTALWTGKAVGELRRVGGTAVSITGNTKDGLTVSGAVGSLAIRDSVNAFIAGSGLPFTGTFAIERPPETTPISAPTVSGPTISGPPDTLFGDVSLGSQDIQNTLDAALADSSIQFKPDSTALTSDGIVAVGKVADALKAVPTVRITITGHTDTNGDANRNLALSVARAEAVRDELGKLGVDLDRITTVGEGGSKPLVPNDTPANRKKNRRIEIRVDQN